jgi:beta-lactam-binding protein with PASTA domain
MTFRILLVCAIAVGGFAFFRLASKSSPSPALPSSDTISTLPVPVPRLVGLPQAAATTLLHTAGLRAALTVVPGPGAGGIVLTQQPAANTNVKPGSVVALSVTPATTAQPSVPNVVGESQAGGTAVLTQEGFSVKGIHRATSTLAAGDIVATTPAANTVVPANSTVSLTISSGPPPVKKAPTVRTTVPKRTPTTSAPRTTTTTVAPTTTTRPPVTTTTRPPVTTTTRPPTTTTTTTTTP